MSYFEPVKAIRIGYMNRRMCVSASYGVLGKHCSSGPVPEISQSSLFQRALCNMVLWALPVCAYWKLLTWALNRRARERRWYLHMYVSLLTCCLLSLSWSAKLSSTVPSLHTSKRLSIHETSRWRQDPKKRKVNILPFLERDDVIYTKSRKDLVTAHRWRYICRSGLPAALNRQSLCVPSPLHSWKPTHLDSLPTYRCYHSSGTSMQLSDYGVDWWTIWCLSSAFSMMHASYKTQQRLPIQWIECTPGVVESDMTYSTGAVGS